MRISYDTLSGAVYIEIEKRKVMETVEFAPEVFLDFDYKKRLIGIELLNPGKIHLEKIAEKYNHPELRKVHPGVIAERVYA